MKIKIKSLKETIIKCGKVEITDKGTPFTTRIALDGKPLEDAYTITSLKYEVCVNGRNAGEHKLTLKGYPRQQ